MKRIGALVVSLAAAFALPDPAAAQGEPPAVCLDAGPETGAGTTGSPAFVVVTLREKVPGSSTCDGPTAEDGEFEKRIDVELTGVNDPDPAATADSPDSPDLGCRIDPGYYVEARCTIALWGFDEGRQTVRAWIDEDVSDPPDGVTEADRDEGVDEASEPGSGCTGGLLDATEPEPDCTDVVEIEWERRPACYPSRTDNGDDRIAAYRRGGGVKAGLYVVDADEPAETRRLASPDDLRLWMWSPDRRKLLYQTGYVNGLDIFTMRADGTHHVRLTPPNKRVDAAPAWSPDSGRVVHSRYGYHNGEHPQLVLVGADASWSKRLTSGGYSSNYPDWSPDGRRIVFSRSKIGDEIRGGLYTIRPGGGDLTELVAGRTLFEFPQYSPGGGWIVFRKPVSKDSARDLFLVRANGRGLRRLTHTGEMVEDYEWSPDGRKIVYEVSSLSGWYELRVVGADGTNDRRILRYFGLGVALAPSWSPDSRFVAYQVPYEVFDPNRSFFGSDVWIAGIDGSCAEAITSTPKIQEYGPEWTTQAATANPYRL